MDLTIKFLLGVIAASLLMGTGIVSAQLWNPFESDCAKSARQMAEMRCENGKWREQSGESGKSEESCYALTYYRVMNACKDKE